MMTRKHSKSADPVGEAVAPAGRTATQAAGPGAIIALLAVFNVIHWTVEQTAAVMTVAIPVWAFVQNWWENRSGRTFLIARPHR